MKSEKGITLISLIVYVIVLTIVVAVIAIVSGFFMKNIKKAMPKFSFFKRLKIVISMWNNLGRDLAEFIFFSGDNFDKISKYINIDQKSQENLLKIKNSNEGELLFKAHFGNWELLSQIFSHYNLKYANYCHL